MMVGVNCIPRCQRTLAAFQKSPGRLLLSPPHLCSHSASLLSMTRACNIISMRASWNLYGVAHDYSQVTNYFVHRVPVVHYSSFKGSCENTVYVHALQDNSIFSHLGIYQLQYLESRICVEYTACLSPGTI